MSITAEILTVGDEIVRGAVVDTNSAFLAGRLEQLGLGVRRITSVGDDLLPLRAEIGAAADRCAVLVVSGGLGPTEDDRTTEALGLATELRPDALAAIRQRFARAGRPMTPNNEKQARVPVGATLIPNDHGTAPGFSVRVGACQVICLPGVPSEMERMFDERVAPLLRERLPGRPALVRQLSTFGIGESQLDDRLSEVLPGVDTGGCRVSVHYRTEFPVNHVFFVAYPGAENTDEAVAAAALDRFERAARDRIGKYVYAAGGETFSEAVVRALRLASATVALAESCTGGLAGDLITRAPGSSEVFTLGVVTYANDAKQRLLGVPAGTLAAHGAVSHACVEAMARGVRALAGATFGVAISGIAGPGGGTEDKPVGTVHFAVAGESSVRHVHRVFPFDRQRVKIVAAHTALHLVMRAAGAIPS